MNPASDTFLGHPKGLFVLFLTEMWERFSYYGMRTLLIFYMIKHLMYSHAEASQVYGLYSGFVYFTPFFGGILADRYLGQRKTVIIGALLMTLGHFVMAFDFLFYPALILLILGNGAFKPNISTQVGNLYADDDPRRDRAFSIFYVGINLGAFLSPLVCGTLGEIYGWHYGFGVAGIGMLLGLLIYLYGQRYLALDNLDRPGEKDKQKEQPVQTDKGDEKSRILVLVIMCLVVILFWVAYEQQGNTIAMWADTDTDRHIFGWEVPATWFQAVNPMFIFLFTPLITAYWGWKTKHKGDSSSAIKMGIGCLLVGAAFTLLAGVAISYDADGIPVNMFWLIGYIAILTLGELYLSPVGLSFVSQLAPARMTSMFMGIWFLAQFAGNYLAGYLGTFWDVWSKEKFFLVAAVIVTAAGLIIFCLSGVLNRLSNNDTTAEN